MLETYIPGEDLNEIVTIEMNEKKKHPKLFDKVLVDVPCTNDRDSLFNMGNNIFSRQRTEERLELPKIQAELLT